MRACVSTSRRVTTAAGVASALAASLVLLSAPFVPSSAFAQDPPPPASAGRNTDKPEEDDYRQTPYTSFGDFNSDEDEAEDTKFFQYGRFFGLSLGVGYEGAFGNRGLLYSGGFPTVELNVHYWFGFNLALLLGISTSTHEFSGDPGEQGGVESFDNWKDSFFKLGASLRYYIDTTDLSAPVTFASPFLELGFANYSRSRTGSRSGDQDRENSLGFNVGGGFQFVVKPKKTYFDLTMKVHSVSFQDSSEQVIIDSTDSSKKVGDANGMFYTVVGSFLFTW